MWISAGRLTEIWSGNNRVRTVLAGPDENPYSLYSKGNEAIEKVVQEEIDMLYHLDRKSVV